MYNLLVKLIILSALVQLGVTVADIEICNSKKCRAKIDAATRDILKIEWRPISVFPEEGRRFR
jgi:hypothetical protein